MEQLTDKERHGRGLDALGAALAPLVGERMQRSAGDRPWVPLYESKEALRRGHPFRVDPTDPRMLLRILRYERGVFTDIDASQRAWLDEVIQAGNRAAHSITLEPRQVDRALDTMTLLAESLDLGRDLESALTELRSTGSVSTPVALEEPAGDSSPDPRPAPSPAAPTDQASQPRPAAPVPDLHLRPGVTALTARIDDLDVVVEHWRALTLSLARSGVSPIVRAYAVNRGLDPAHDVAIDLSIEPLAAGDGVPVAPPIRVALGGVPGTDRRDAPSDAVAMRTTDAPFLVSEEALTTSIAMTVTVGTRSWQASSSIDVLAADEWRRDHGPEILAAFVRPNDPAIAQLLDEASALLQQRTGSPSLQGYQSGPERVHLIAEAVYDAMQARGITYVEPPSSFESTGQRVRSHSEVLDERRGTCIDLACTYAAALEQAGITPLLVLFSGHAVAGYLTEEVQLSSPVLTGVGEVRNLLDSDVCELVETTALCAGDTPTSFDDARGHARRRVVADPDDVRFVMHVGSAHLRVKPLPTMRWEGGVRVIEVVREKPVAPSRRLPSTTTAAPTSGAPPRVEAWRRSLLDMSYVNPLLKLKPAGTAGLHVPAGALSRFEDAVSGGTSFVLRPNDQLTDLMRSQGLRHVSELPQDQLDDLLLREFSLFTSYTGAEYSRRLKNLQRRARTAVEETGSDILYLTLGRLRWTEDKREGNAPLFLVPVRLLKGRGTSPFEIALDPDRAREPNFCLHEKLRGTWGLDLPQLVTPGEDAAGIDIDGAIGAIRSALLRSEKSEFYVEESAHLALLQFSTLEMWRDLSENWRDVASRPAVKHLVENAGQPFDDAVAAPEPDATAEATTYLPVSADGSQLEAVRWAAAGKSFILEGPPGTGKSQTITNLVAHCLAVGKTVLFVAEKQAALDVVKRRLDDVGLGTFSLDVHGRSQSVGEVRDQLRTALEQHAAGDPSWSTLQSGYRSVVESLSRYPDQLHEPGPAGLSAWDARQVLLELEDAARGVEPLPVPRGVVMGGAPLEDVYGAARGLGNALLDLGLPPSQSPWRLAGRPGPDGVDRAGVVDALAALVAADERVQDAGLRAVADHARGSDQLAALADWLEAHAHGVARTARNAVAVVTPAWRQQTRDALDAVTAFRQGVGSGLAPFPVSALSSDLDALLARSEQIDKRLFGKKKRRLALLAEVGVDGATDGFPLATTTESVRRLHQIRHALAELRARLNAVPGVGVPPHWNPLELGHAARPADAVRGWKASRRLADAYGADPRSAQTVAEMSERVVGGAALPASAAQDVRAMGRAWQRWLEVLRADDASVARWQGDRTRGQALAADLPAWRADAAGGALVRLSRWCGVRDASARLQALGLDGVEDRALSDALAGADLETRTRLGVAREVVAERLDTTGLVGFDDASRVREIDRFVSTGQDVRARMVAELPARIVAARTFDATRPKGQVAELQSQLGRRRGGLTIRQLLHRFGSLITQITPCVLMSPASVARFLPAQDLEFDVVVFDEASQIRVPEAIGAMGRGKAVVIVGDSKQMPPTSMFASSAATDDEDQGAAASDSLPVPLDLESILSEGKESQLPRLLLTWHYRSRDESLIAFSNQHYYEGRLSSFPTPPSTGSSALELRRVHGVWEGGTRGARVNRAEAEAVVAEVRALASADADRSIGVVTFNTQQRDLILDMLEQEAESDRALAAAMAREEEPVFVKNLENVQGDERDVILFTLAFAKDERTGRVPLTWGPLVRDGGEKRLNVAVTRAKARVVVFASFEPHELDLAGSRSVGLAHLKDYLTMAKAGVENTPLRRPAARDRHLEEVAAALRAAGLEVRTSVGLSDFTVDVAVRRDAGAPWVAVLLDGPAWASRGSVGDREGLPASVLTGAMGWRATERVWFPAWVRDADEVVRRVVAAAERVALAPLPPAPAADPIGHTTAPVERPTPAPAVAAPAWPTVSSAAQAATTTPVRGIAAVSAPAHPTFEPASDRPIYPKSDLEGTGAAVRNRIVREAHAVVDAEGPILVERLIRIIGARFDFGRVRASRRDQIVRYLPREIIHRSANGDDVAWPATVAPATYTAFRLPATGGQRSIDEIPYEELRNALIDVVRSAHGIGVEDGMRETARLFGVTRLASAVRPRLESVVEAAVGEGRLEREDDELQARGR